MNAWYTGLLESGRLPDSLVRTGIRRLLRQRLREEGSGGIAAQQARLQSFVDELRRSPIAIETAAANRQHYEVPARFFQLILGPHVKYSCGAWPPEVRDLEQAERTALEWTTERARISPGDHILELGCGWGSFSLYAAARLPECRITAVSNSRTQKEFIVSEAARRGIRNLQIVTADINTFVPTGRFDRVVSVEMFEHLRNYPLLLERMHGWTNPGATLFVHVFAHSRFAYPFEVRDAGDWMAEHFFTGGLMPSTGLLLNFQDHFALRNQWVLDGTHYQKTAEAWLRRLDDNREEVLSLFRAVYGEDAARMWLARWRIFLMACAELFGYQAGQEWVVSHYLFERK